MLGTDGANDGNAVAWRCMRARAAEEALLTVESLDMDALIATLDAFSTDIRPGPSVGEQPKVVVH